MDEPLMLRVDAELIHQIKTTLRECAEDLQASLDAEYPEEDREKYPTYRRRYQRDREPVVDALYCLDRLTEVLPHDPR